MKLKNKVIMITGASQGLGRVVAQKVAEQGAKVALIARSEKLLKGVKAEILKKGGEAEYFICDISENVQVQSTVKQVIKHFAGLDILVNNAGIWTDDEIEKENPQMRWKAFQINALGNIQCCEAVLPYFEQKNAGYVFNVISTSGVSDILAGDNKFWKTYGATKWAFAGYTKALHDKLAQTKIKVTGFFPGGFDSNLYENAGKKDPHQQPWMMKVEDIAEIILFALTRPDDVLMERIIVSKVF
jgi:short-subunit dehydrogenase